MIGIGVAIGVVVLCAIGLVLLVIFIRKRTNERENSYSSGNNSKTIISMPTLKESSTQSSNSPTPVIFNPSSSNDNQEQMVIKGDYAELPQTNQEQTNHQYSTMPMSNGPSKSQDPLQILLDRFEVNFDDLQISDQLGSGNFGSVFLAFYKKEPLAVKRLNESPQTSLTPEIVSASEALKKKSKAYEDFVHEAKLLSSIPPNPHVVRFFGLCRDPFCILTEYLDGGSLYNHIRQPTLPFTVGLAMSFLKQIAMGIDHLHKNGIVHRDLAARNVLLRTGSKNPECVLVDMGLSRLFETGGDYVKTRSAVALKWSAPELLREKKFSFKSDIWSYAVVAVEV